MSIQQLKQTLQEVQETSQHEIHIRTATEIYKKVSREIQIYCQYINDNREQQQRKIELIRERISLS